MRLIDADELRKNVLKWMPSDPCGKEEKEFPFETDICVSMIMEIDETPTIEPEQQWIPVTEIPPYGKDLMIRFRDKRNGCRYSNYYVMGFYDGKEYQTYLFRHQDDHDIEVTGWMICPWEADGEQDE